MPQIADNKRDIDVRVDLVENLTGVVNEKLEITSDNLIDLMLEFKNILNLKAKDLREFTKFFNMKAQEMQEFRNTLNSKIKEVEIIKGHIDTLLTLM
jgi:hypothetical protein